MQKAFMLSILFSSILISGCEDKHSKEWYISHHKEMIDKYTECLFDNNKFESIECQNAKDAVNQEKGQPDIKEEITKAHQKLRLKIRDQASKQNEAFSNALKENKH
ncbi:EexN family lipoprotein [Salmonella enterica subsp. enterica serovar Wilhelmsburg]|nr:EexN family lipoprotein [Salmonella enterica subsp. enterica serovar Wilhelmsburg]